MESLPEKPAVRPAALTLLCQVAGVFTGTLSLLFLSGLVYSVWIQRVSDQYLTSTGAPAPDIKLIFIAGFISHLTSFTGIILIHKLKRAGFYILAVSLIVIISGSFFFPAAVLVSPLIYLALLIFFAFYLRNLG
jgi:hypothetical protein